jgi:hypothetical protein
MEKCVEILRIRIQDPVDLKSADRILSHFFFGILKICGVEISNGKQPGAGLFREKLGFRFASALSGLKSPQRVI